MDRSINEFIHERLLCSENEHHTEEKSQEEAIFQIYLIVFNYIFRRLTEDFNSSVRKDKFENLLLWVSVRHFKPSK